MHPCSSRSCCHSNVSPSTCRMHSPWNQWQCRSQVKRGLVASPQCPVWHSQRLLMGGGRCPEGLAFLRMFCTRTELEEEGAGNGRHRNRGGRRELCSCKEVGETRMVSQVTAEGGGCAALRTPCSCCLEKADFLCSPDSIQSWFMKAHINYQYKNFGCRRPDLSIQAGIVFKELLLIHPFV